MRNRQRKVEKDSFSPVPFPSLERKGKKGRRKRERRKGLPDCRVLASPKMHGD